MPPGTGVLVLGEVHVLRYPAQVGSLPWARVHQVTPLRAAAHVAVVTLRIRAGPSVPESAGLARCLLCLLACRVALLPGRGRFQRKQLCGLQTHNRIKLTATSSKPSCCCKGDCVQCCGHCRHLTLPVRAACFQKAAS